MKKNFTTPVIESRALTAQNSIMDEDLAIFAASAGQQTPRSGLSLSDGDAKSGYSAWKGFN